MDNDDDTSMTIFRITNRMRSTRLVASSNVLIASNVNNKTTITTTTTTMAAANTSATSTDSIDSADKQYKNLIHILVILLVVVIVIGIFGNVLNMIIFKKKQMRKGSTFRFLFYLSIFDLLVLLVCATDALGRFGFQFEIRSLSTLTCRLHTFLTYFLIHSSSIILMIISVDRALVVTNYSFKSILSKSRLEQTKSSLNSKRSDHKRGGSKLAVFLHNLHRVDVVIGLIVIILVLLNGHYLLLINLNPISINSTNATSNKTGEVSYCMPLESSRYYNFLINVWLYIDICVAVVIPFIIMSVCSVIILSRIRKKNKKYFNNLLQSRTSESNRTNACRRSKRSRQLLYMLLITNLYFFLSQLPYCVTFVLFRGQEDEKYVDQFIVHILSYTNNAVNFLFYGLSSQKYRQELCRLFVNGPLPNSASPVNAAHHNLTTHNICEKNSNYSTFNPTHQNNHTHNQHHVNSRENDNHDNRRLSVVPVKRSLTKTNLK